MRTVVRLRQEDRRVLPLPQPEGPTELGLTLGACKVMQLVLALPAPIYVRALLDFAVLLWFLEQSPCYKVLVLHTTNN